jgi:hypothetical protein
MVRGRGRGTTGRDGGVFVGVKGATGCGTVGGPLFIAGARGIGGRGQAGGLFGDWRCGELFDARSVSKGEAGIVGRFPRAGEGVFLSVKASNGVLTTSAPIPSDRTWGIFFGWIEGTSSKGLKC